MAPRNPDDDGVRGGESHRTSPLHWTVRTVLALASAALLSFVAATVVFDFDPFGPFGAPPPPPSPPLSSVPPCEWLSDFELEQLAERWWTTVEAGLRTEPLAETERAIEVRAEEAFAPVYAQIPEFLDWHYSMAGQYTQLAVVIVALLEDWGFPRALGRLAGSEPMQVLVDWLRVWDPTRETIERLAGLDLPAAARERLDRLQRQVDIRLFGDLSGRVRLASDEVERVMRAEMRDLVARRIRNEMDMLPIGARSRGAGPCSDVETLGVGLAYEDMLEAAVPETVRRFTAAAAPTGIFAVAAGVRSAAAARAILRGLSGRLTRRLLPRLGRLIGVGVGAGAWLFLDLLVLYADEYFTREEFQAELTALVDEQKAGLKADLAARADEIRVTALGPFTPAALEGAD